MIPEKFEKNDDSTKITEKLNIVLEDIYKRFMQLDINVFDFTKGEARLLTDPLIKQTSVTNLDQTISGPSTAEVQAISDKVDALLVKLREANVIET